MYTIGECLYCKKVKPLKEGVCVECFGGDVFSSLMNIFKGGKNGKR
jgi:hypothetical protein